jgi:hypothetical protein
LVVVGLSPIAGILAISRAGIGGWALVGVSSSCLRPPTA